MDLNETLRELRAQRDKLAAVIEQLESINGSGSPAGDRVRSRRGRKYMDAEERREVSARMKRYWAGRRKAKDNA